MTGNAGARPSRRALLAGLLACQLPMPTLFAAPEQGEPAFPSALAAYLGLSPAQVREAVNRHGQAVIAEARLRSELEAAEAQIQAPRNHSAENRAAKLRRRLAREQAQARDALRRGLDARQRKLLDDIARTPGLETLAQQAAAAGFMPSAPVTAPAESPCAAASGTAGKARQDLCDQRG